MKSRGCGLRTNKKKKSSKEPACLKITHERIASHMGTAREVVTRMLRYFQSEGMVRLSRGEIAITDPDALRALSQ